MFEPLRIFEPLRMRTGQLHFPGLIAQSIGEPSERIDRAVEGKSTVADEYLAGDPAGLVESQDRFGDVVGGTEPAEGGALRHPCQPPSVTGHRTEHGACR